MRRASTMLIAAAGLAGALVGTRSLWADGVEYRVVASSAMPPPGVAAGAGFQVGAPSIDQNGIIAFRFRSSIGRFSVMGTPGNYRTILSPTEAAEGQYANQSEPSLITPLILDQHSAIVGDRTGSFLSYIRATDTGASVFALHGQTLPGVPNARIPLQPSTHPTLVGQADSLVLATRTESTGLPLATTGSGIWRTDAGVTRLIAHSSLEAPGAGGVMFSPADYWNGGRIPGSMVMNPARTLAFFAQLMYTGLDPEAPRAGIWIDTPERGLQAVVLAGASSSFAMGGVGTASISINRQGDIAFQGGSQASGSGIFIRDHGGTIRPAFAGSGLLQVEGHTLAGVYSPMLNDHAQTLSHVRLTPRPFARPESGLVLTGDTAPRIVWADGISRLPGNSSTLALATGSQFVTSSSGLFGVGQEIASFNNLGQAVFILDSQFPGQPDYFVPSQVLAGWDPSGGLIELARVGGPVPLPGYEGQTVTFINWLGGSNGVDGRPASLNDNGDVVFSVQTSAGQTAVILAHLPTPSAAVPLCILGLLASRRRR